MTGEHARHAADAAEAIRALNHATLPGTGGLTYPADAYEALGQLAVLAARLPQALAQILAFLAAGQDAGRIVIVAGDHAGDPAAALTAAPACLDAAIDGAQNALTWAGAAEMAGG